MQKTKKWGIVLAASAAGIVNGLLGAGGGMVLVPLLTLFSALPDTSIFPVSIAIILPLCVVSLTVTAMAQPIPWLTALPYLIGSAIGGLFAGYWGKKIPVVWLHKGLGILILWGAFQYIW